MLRSCEYLWLKAISLEEEYTKDTGITREDIAVFRQWLKTQPHLPEDFITDLDLILAYHSCGRSMEVSKQVLDLNLTLRTLFTSIFKDRWFDVSIEKSLNTAVMSPLKTRARDGSGVFYGGLIDQDPKSFELTPCLRTALMAIDLWQYEEGTWPGFIMVFDMAGLKFGHVAKLSLQELQQILYFLQEAMLVKIKGLHFLNPPSLVDRVIGIIKPFLKNELLDMLTIHQPGSTTIDQFVDIKTLPKESGGEGFTSRDLKEQMVEKFRANSEFFKMENRKRVCEAKRPGKPKTMSDIFDSVEGTFKKLDID